MKIELNLGSGTAAAPAVTPGVRVAAPSADHLQEQAGAAGTGAPLRSSLAELVDSLNAATRTLRTSLQFLVEEDSQQVVVRVVDSATGQVIRTIPPEHLVKAHETMQTLVGLLLDVKV